MQIDHQDLDDVIRVVLVGRLDTAGVGAIEFEYNSRLGTAFKPVIVDLSGVSFLASLGVRMFISTARVLTARKGRVALYGATPEVAEMIEVTGLGEIVPVAADEAGAIAAVQS
jgi:anti-anti-sigma factor